MRAHPFNKVNCGGLPDPMVNNCFERSAKVFERNDLAGSLPQCDAAVKVADGRTNYVDTVNAWHENARTDMTKNSVSAAGALRS